MLLRSVLVCVLLLANIGVANGHNRMASYPPTISGGSNWSFNPQPTVKPQTTIHRKHSFKHLVRRHLRIPVRHTAVPVLSKNSGDLVTVPTAAGIPITVERKLVPQFQGFVADLVKLGYTPHHIGCWAPYGTHVANSNHYHGGACDFDQTGWGRTSPQMYHVGALAAKWGLRDGCTFRHSDCGHIDDGTNIGWKHPNNLIARYIDYQTSPKEVKKAPAVLDNFEGGL